MIYALSSDNFISSLFYQRSVCSFAIRKLICLKTQLTKWKDPGLDSYVGPSQGSTISMSKGAE